MELNEGQLKLAEKQLKMYLPLSQSVYGTLALRNRVLSDPLDVIVDKWPDFRVIICRPKVIQKEDLFKDSVVFTTDPAAVEDLIRSTSVFDWTRFLCLGTALRNIGPFKTIASEKNLPVSELAVCHMMTLEDVTKLPPVDSSGITLGSLDEAHVQLVNRTWKFSQDSAVTMIRNMVLNFPSKCVLDEKGQPVSWILTYNSGAIGMLYTKPEHRGKGYAKTLVSVMARRLHSEGFPVYCFVEEKNRVSYTLFRNLGFTEEDPDYRTVWYGFNELNF